MFSYTIKRMIVKRNQFADNLRESLEQKLQKKFHAACVVITNGEVIIKYFAGREGDPHIEVPFFKAIVALLGDGAPMPSNWREVAEHWVLGGISLDQVEEMLHCSIVDIPEEFFKYAQSVEDDYYNYLAENAEDPYYM